MDPATGETIHECSEPLSGHWGHGSAKGKVPSDADNVQGGPSPPAPPEAAP